MPRDSDGETDPANAVSADERWSDHTATGSLSVMN